MVVPSTVPSTRTLTPLPMARADVELVPFVYLVDDFLSRVTFCPADVVIVKLAVDPSATVPAAPPAAGPERALDPARPGRPLPAVAERDATVVVVPELLPPAVALTIP